VVHAARDAGVLVAAHDLSDGGLALAGVDMALAGSTGLRLSAQADLSDTEWLFGEDQGRYLVSVAAENADRLLEIAQEAGVTAQVVGEFGGDTLDLCGASVPLAEIKQLHKSGLDSLTT